MRRTLFALDEISAEPAALADLDADGSDRFGQQRFYRSQRLACLRLVEGDNGFVGDSQLRASQTVHAALQHAPT